MRHNSRELAKLSSHEVPSQAAWDQKIAPITTGEPAEIDAALIARTATLDDPLTTSLLAEVTRRSRTVDLSPPRSSPEGTRPPATHPASKTAADRDPSSDPA